MTALLKSHRNIFILATVLFVLCEGLAVYTGLYIIALVPVMLAILLFGWQNPSVIFYLLLFSLPFSFEYSFSSGLGTDIPDEFLMLFTSFLFLLYVTYHPGKLNGTVLRHPLLFLFLLLTGWSLVTVLFSTDIIVSVKYLLAKGWYAGAFILAPLVLFRDRQSFIRSVVILTTAMVLVVLITMVRHYDYDFSFATINDALYPFFRNHVNYSAMLVCFIPVLVAFYQLVKSRRQKQLIIFCVLLLLTALFFSFARGAWLALVAGFIAGWLIQKKFMLQAFLLSVLLIITAVFWIKKNDRYLLYAHDYKTTVFHKDFGEHLAATYKLKDVSTAERFYRWIAGVRMIKDKWTTGYGPGTFYANYKPYAVPAYKTWVSDNKDHSTIHNYFLLTIIEQGLPGILFFLLLTGAMFYYAQQLYHRIADPLFKTAALTTGVILTMLLVVNFLSDLIETDKVGSLFFLCLSVLVITDVNTRQEKNIS